MVRLPMNQGIFCATERVVRALAEQNAIAWSWRSLRLSALTNVSERRAGGA